MNIGIIGAGVVGSATGRVLEQKHQVRYYDRYKSGLEDIGPLARESDIVFVCVPTPMKATGEMDYSAINHSLDNLLGATARADREPEDLITVIRSTAVSGTTEKLAEEYPFKFAFNPEFLREKHAEEDMRNTDRVVIGANDPLVSEKIMHMYEEVFPHANYFCVKTRDAEMIKYAANVTLASQVAIANEIYNICKVVGVNYNTVKEVILHDKRIGTNIDVPGPDGDFGFGGKCFPKDLNALIYLAQTQHYPSNLLREVWRSNLDFREKMDWLDIKGATTANDFKK
ncbi:hypothetical protein KW805_04115 [Candidatus Pacearchaeota archaeon]|nr:hypothetical protein [Candidatus Pacearchaeota archaeon]